MKKAITIYVDDCVKDIEEVCATIILHKETGTTSVHMFNWNLKGNTALYLPWRGEARMFKEEGQR